jgi:hypothetical protein
MSHQRLYDLFNDMTEQLGYDTEPFRMYRPHGVNVESYIRFIAMSSEPFATHEEAIAHYLTRVARPVSPPPRFTILSQ